MADVRQGEIGDPNGTEELHSIQDDDNDDKGVGVHNPT